MIDITFYLSNSSTSTTVLSGTVSDQRNYLDILLECTQPSIFSSAQVFIAKITGNNVIDSSPIGYPMKIGNNYIGNPDVVGANEIAYVDAAGNGKFENNVRYSIKIKVFLKGQTNNTLTYFPKFGENALSAYSFLYRADGGDQFSSGVEDPDTHLYDESACVVVNDTVIEGSAGSDIIVKAPINFVNSNDTRTPSNLTFTFDEVNNYEGTENDSENVDQLSYYSVNVPYDASGNYTLQQTDDNHLTNDMGYYVNVMAIYSDGYTVSKTFNLVLHVIERPVIASVVAYGLASDQSDAGELGISSVMNVYMSPYSTGEQVNLPSSTDTVTFNLSQGGVVMYKAELPVSNVVSDDTILYTILKADLVKVWTTTAPTQKANGSYEYDVTANILHYTLYENEFIARVSNSVTKTFTSDIVPLNSVVVLNAWVAATNVAGTGHRTVDISNATTAEGYALAPELGIVGKFSKNDFYGSGINDGFFQDLDAEDASGNALTNHTFTVNVNGTSKTVTALYQIQGHSNKSDQEMYNELFDSVNNAPNISNINGVETVLTTSQVQGVKADSNPIISIDDNESGWSIVNTGPNTNGATGGKLPKVNLYFYANTTAAASQTASNSFTLNQANGVGMYAVFHQNAGAKEYPFFNAYTTPMASGNKASWYRSKVFFGPQTSDGNTVSDNSKVGSTLVYTGTDDATLFPHIPSNRRVKYEIKYGANLTNSFGDETVFSTEYINLVSLATSSNAATSQAGSFNFRLLETGIFTSNDNFDQVSLRYNVTDNGDAVSDINGVKTVLTTSQVQGVKADSNSIISIDDNESGWSIVNTGPNTNGATGGKLPKVNLYFYANTTAAASQTASNSFTLNQANGVGMYAVFHQNAGAKEYPFFNAYTTPMASGNKASWYRSKVFFGPQTSDGNTVSDNSKVGSTLVYTGTDDATLFPHIPSNRRVKYEIKYGANLTNSFGDETVFSTEYINLVSLATSSNAATSQAGSFNFRLLETGIFTSNDNFDQVSLRYNVLSRKYTSENGKFPNLPGPDGVLGSAQNPIYFWIPHTDLFGQTDSVKVSIAIEPPAGETTRPSATESDAEIIVAKVNRYEMTLGTDSEPEFANGTLTVPISNASTLANEYYFESAIFTSDNAAPNDVKEVDSSNGGVFDILVVNPSIRGANCNYQVRYKINDPNDLNGTITGPISDTYSIALFNEPGLDNFNVTNFSYDTFADDNVSKFKFDIEFLTVDSRTVDGVYVYFKSTNDDANAANDIPLTELMIVSRTNGSSQSNVSYTLQNTAAANANLSEGVKIKNKLGADSVNKWLNFRSGEIVFKPYKGSTIQSVQTERNVYNIPKITLPANLTFAGGIKESYDATKVAWNDALSAYASVSSSVTASYKLVANGTEVSGQVANHGYTIDLSSYAAGDAVALTLQVKITTAIDSLDYLSDPVALNFVVSSIDISGLNTMSVKRGSNENTLKVTRGDVVITPISGATVTEVKLIDNVNSTNTNPTDASVEGLTCTSTTAAIQPAGPTTVNEYDLTPGGGNDYDIGDVIDLQYRAKAGVSYTLTYGSASPVTAQSTPLYLTLQAAEVKYVVAKSPKIAVESSYRMVSSGTYAGRIAINVNINANGLHAEGLQSVVFILAQEGDVTNPAVSEGGIQHMIAFETSNGLTKSYTVGPDASLLPSSTDNLGATEVQEVSVLDVDGFTQ